MALPQAQDWRLESYDIFYRTGHESKKIHTIITRMRYIEKRWLPPDSFSRDYPEPPYDLREANQ